MSEKKLVSTGGDDRVCQGRPVYSGGDDRVCQGRPVYSGGDDRVCQGRPVYSGGDDRVCHTRPFTKNIAEKNIGLLFQSTLADEQKLELNLIEKEILSAKIKI